MTGPPPQPPRPNSPELHAELVQLAAMRLVRFGPEGLADVLRVYLEGTAFWPGEHARTWAAQVAAEAASWQNGQLLEHYRAWREADGFEFEPPENVRRQARLQFLQDDAWAHQHLADAQRAEAAGQVPEKPGMALGDFLVAAPEVPEFEIPDLVPKASRVVLTGEEGAGKSTVLRFAAACHAAGIHPFTGERYEGGMSLVLDCENPVALQQMRLAELAERLEPEATGQMRHRLVADAQPGGIDLAEAYWQEYVRRMVDAWKITFLAIGPLYKLCSLKPMGEEFFTACSAFFDRLRTGHGCAVWIESHCRQPAPGQWGGRDMFPYGNSGWRRWPEAGMYLSRSGALTEWRPNRFGEEVSWPVRLDRVPGSQVQWEAAYTAGSGGGGDSEAEKIRKIRAAAAGQPGLSKRQLKAAAHDDGTGITAAVKAGAVTCQPAAGAGKASKYFVNPDWPGGAVAGGPPPPPNFAWMAEMVPPEDEPW